MTDSDKAKDDGLPDVPAVVKPGYKTSEGWISAVFMLVTLLISFGAIPGADEELLKTALSKGIISVFALLSSKRIISGNTSG